MLLKTFGTRLHMKKEYLWIGVGSLLCIVLVTFTLFVISTPTVQVRAKNVPVVSSVVEEYASPQAIQKTIGEKTSDPPQSTPDFQPSLSLSLFPSSFFKKDSRLLDGFIIVSPTAPESVRTSALELNQQLVPGQTAHSDPLEIGVDFAGGPEGEWPGVSCKDLSVLCIGSLANLYNRFQYTETLFTPRGRVEYRIDPDNKGPGPQPYFFIPQENETYRYKITFLPALESLNRVTATGAGRLEGTGTSPDTELSLWGKEYILIDAFHPKQYQLTITLVGGIKDILAEGEERTYDIDGDLVTIKPLLINQNDVQFVINGERIKSMTDDETRIIPSVANRSIAVHEILENEGPEETGDDLVEFYFGDMLELTDTNTTAPSKINEKGEFDGSTVVWNKEDLTNVDVSIITTLDNGLADLAKVNVKSIELRSIPSDDLYGWGRLSKQAERIELGNKGTFLNLFDIDYRGLFPLPEYHDRQVVDEYVFHPSDDDSYKLKWRNADGNEYDYEMVGCTADDCSNISYGKRSGSTFYDLVVDETDHVAENEYFFLVSDIYSYLMMFDNLDTNDNVITLREIRPELENEREPTYEISYDGTSGLGYFDFAHSTFTFNVTNESSGTIRVDMDGDGLLTDTAITLRTRAGGDFNFSTTLEPRIQYQTNELYEDTRRDALDFRPYFDVLYKRLDINESDVSGTWKSGFNSSNSAVNVNRTLEINNTDVSTGLMEFGLRAELTDADSQNQSTLTLFAPKYQLFGALDIFPTTFKKLVKRPKDFTGNEKGNLVLIGGPCENPATAAVVAFGKKETDCFLGAKKGQAVIRMYARDSGTALVVAGIDEQATLDAIEVLKDPEKYLKDVDGDRVAVVRENGKIVVREH